MKIGRQNYSPRGVADDGEPLPRRTYAYHVCGGGIGRRSSERQASWHTGMKVAMLDKIVIDLLLERLGTLRFPGSTSILDYETRTQRDDLTVGISKHEDYLESVRADAAVAHRLDLILDQEARVRPLIDAARRKLAELSIVDPVAQDLAEAGNIRTMWDDLELAHQRRVIRGTMTPVIHRIDKEWIGRRGLNPNRVEAVWN